MPFRPLKGGAMCSDADEDLNNSSDQETRARRKYPALKQLELEQTFKQAAKDLTQVGL